MDGCHPMNEWGVKPAVTYYLKLTQRYTNI
jgi:hypothetical protein